MSQIMLGVGTWLLGGGVELLLSGLGGGELLHGLHPAGCCHHDDLLTASRPKQISNLAPSGQSCGAGAAPGRSWSRSQCN